MDAGELPFLQQITLICRKALYIAAFFSLFINLLMLTVPLYMLQLYDRVLASHSYETLIYLTLIAIFALLTFALLDMARSRVLVHVGQWIDQVLSPEALDRGPDEILAGGHYGAQALRDITNLRQFIAGSGIISLFDAPWVPIYLIVIFLLNPWLGLVALLGSILLFGLALFNEFATRKLLAEANNKAITSNTYAEHSLRNAEATQAMGMSSNIIHHWQQKNISVLNLQVLASNRAGFILAISKFMRLVMQVLMLGVGGYLVLQNQLTAGAMIAGSILLTRALAPVEQAISVWKQLISAREAYQRLNKHFTQVERPIAHLAMPRPKGHLQLDNVIYRVPEVKAHIIAGISLDIKPGEMVAIIGPSGAGKSTLARLIVGAIKATAGDVRLDSADVYTWERSSFGQHVGYLPQDLELFPGTIKENIARLGEAEDADIIAAAQLAGAHDMILHLPQSYDTQIISNSHSLSGGQLQRIALARAFYKQPCLIVLDEPNSNLDSEGEQALANALLTLRNQKTTQIMVAHRHSIIQHVDRIIVLIEGKIQLMGPRDEILSRLKTMPQRPKQ